MASEFVTPREYNQLSPLYYDNLLKSKNPLRKAFHNGRFIFTKNLVRKYLANKDEVIVDLACGSCNWNNEGFNVIGVDVAVDMLKHAKRQGRIKKALIEECFNTSIILLKSTLNFSSVISFTFVSG